MSRVNDERKYKNPGTTQTRSAKKPTSKYVVFRPNTIERETIKADKAPIERVMASMAKWVQRDAKLTIGHKAENGAYFVHLTDLGVDWQEAVTLSVWHSDLETALRTMYYGLCTAYEAFPDIQLALFSDDLSW